jgi:hypothetical protein
MYASCVGPPKNVADFTSGSSFFSKKRGGNVHKKGIVTSKSVYRDTQYPPDNVADFTYDTIFHSKDDPGQWVCWDFHEMRVRPTHYTIWGYWLKSWVVEGSLDGQNWTEIDRKMNNQDFKGREKTVSFTVSNPVECRFIRLTQTDKNWTGDYHSGRADQLHLGAVEFFGTLSE